MNRLNQIDLITAIMNHLDNRGVKDATPRIVNAIIAAANQIIEAVETPHKPATAGMGLDAWLQCDETGLSSKYMASALTGRHCKPDPSYGICTPRDGADFGRCVGLLTACPELRDKLAVLAAPEHGLVWAGVVAQWAELEAIYHRDLATGNSKELYERIRAIEYAVAKGLYEKTA